MVIPSNVEVPLSSKESHVHLHLGIKMTHPSGLLLLLLAAVFLHLPDGVQEEQDQDGHLEGDTEDAEDGWLVGKFYFCHLGPALML